MERYYWFAAEMPQRRKALVNKAALTKDSIIWFISKEDFSAKIYFYGKDKGLKLLKTYKVKDINGLKENSWTEVDRQAEENGIRVEVDSLAQFVKIADILDKSGQSIYRGQENEEWDLKASIFRREYNDKKEFKIYNDIKRYNYKEFQSENFFSNVIRMQHYGIPTRLLDWSRNPLVALYFACENEYVNGKVFSCTPENILDFNKSDYKLLSKYFEQDFNGVSLSEDVIDYLSNLCRTGRHILVEPPYENERIRAQHGLFSLGINIKRDYITKVRQKIWERVGKDILDKVEFDKIHMLQEKEFVEEIEACNVDEQKKQRIIDSLHQIQFWNLGNMETEAKLDSSAVEIIIPRERKLEIRKQLEKVGIDELSVYPDLNGFIQYINKKYK